jgi:prevent-host-death family protein
MIVDISKAKVDLLKLINRVNRGERVTIVKDNKPVADLVSHNSRKIRKLGLLQGKLLIPDGFNDENDEIISMFYGKDK